MPCPRLVKQRTTEVSRLIAARRGLCNNEPIASHLCPRRFPLGRALASGLQHQHFPLSAVILIQVVAGTGLLGTPSPFQSRRRK